MFNFLFQEASAAPDELPAADDAPGEVPAADIVLAPAPKRRQRWQRAPSEARQRIRDGKAREKVKKQDEQLTALKGALRCGGLSGSCSALMKYTKVKEPWRVSNRLLVDGQEVFIETGIIACVQDS